MYTCGTGVRSTVLILYQVPIKDNNFSFCSLTTVYPGMCVHVYHPHMMYRTPHIPVYIQEMFTVCGVVPSWYRWQVQYYLDVLPYTHPPYSVFFCKKLNLCYLFQFYISYFIMMCTASGGVNVAMYHKYLPTCTCAAEMNSAYQITYV